MILIEVLLITLASVLLIPATVLLLQVLYASTNNRAKKIPVGPRPSVAVVMPAHNEALVIAGALRSILSQLAPGDRMLVVADNCSDHTARIAFEAGAEVFERDDPTLRGKGYALDFGMRQLRKNPPQIVVFIDGDCAVTAGTIERLAHASLTTGRPVQACYLMHAPPQAGLRARIAEFAWLVKNKVRPLGFARFGLPCQLMGTGMAFPWSVISMAPLANGHLVEDLKLGLDLTRTGMPPLYCVDALVTSNFPTTAQGWADQRQRWEHGHLGMILSVAPRLFTQSLVRGNLPTLALALDLCVPPLALLMLQLTTVFLLSAIFFALTMLALPLWLASAALALTATAVLLAWVRHGQHVVSWRDVACMPLYALSKIPLYFRFVTKRQRLWVRTRRDAE